MFLLKIIVYSKYKNRFLINQIFQLYFVRQWRRNRRTQIIVAPMFADVVQRGEKFVDIERRDELQPRRLEIGQSFEVVRQVAAHFENAHMLAFDFQRFS